MSSPRAVGGKLRLKGGLPSNYKYAPQRFSPLTWTSAQDSLTTLTLDSSRKRKRVVEAEENGHAQIDSDRAAVDSRMDTDYDEMPTLTAPEVTNKTAAQLAFERQLRRTEKEHAGASVTMTHRQRIDEYNKRLSAMTEHHDIPKVGPG